MTAIMRFVVFSLLVVASLAERVRYDGYQTLRIEPRDEHQRSVIHRLIETQEDKLDFWVPSLNKPADVMVAPRYQSWLKHLLDEAGIEYSVMIEDVQALIDYERDMDRASATFSYNNYNTYEQMCAWMDDMVAYSSYVTKFWIATSGKDQEQIYALKVSSGGTGKKVVYMQGGLHAREWISPATVIYMTKLLLDLDTLEGYLEEFDFVIVPLLNVDGYKYSWDVDRMWRKTRSDLEGSAQVGVDGNRNYPYKWGGAGASTSPRSDTYRGPNPLSEPEVLNTTEYLSQLGNVAVFIDVHSYSQLWLSPWSYIADSSDDFVDHQAAGELASKALAKRYGTQYTVGPSAETLYAASGVSVDWAHETLGAKYAVTVELRDKGGLFGYGFLLPEEQIEPSGLETFDGFMAYIDYAIDHP
ncbi:carboxypeptidase B-like isoform X1 [Diadema setosum]|uniref:carboxypeptidase B-like isoform X1 n=2 Tax=Diadema setosum TaxID=31175 RepID=UPI003B3B6FE2